MTDVPPVLRSLLAEAFPNSPRLVRVFEDLAAALLEAKATAEAAAAGSVQLAPVLLTEGSEAFEFGRVLGVGGGLALDLDTEGVALVTVDGTVPRIDGGHSVTFITTGTTALLLPETGQLATLADVGSVVGAITAADVAFAPTGGIAATNVQAALAELDTEKLAASAYTAADVLAKLLTVDGSGSGLDADTLRGTIPTTSALTLIALNAAQGDLVYGSAAGVFSILGKNASATRYLSNTGAGNNPAWAQVDLTNGVTGDLPFANIVQIATAKVLGRATAGTGDIEELATTGTGNVVLSASPTLTGTIGAVGATFSGAVTAAGLSLANNQNATTTFSIVNTDTASSASRGQMTVQGGDVSYRVIAINTSGLFLGTTTAHDVQFQRAAIGICAVTATGFEPASDNTQFLGRNDDDSPKAWKGLILRDQAAATYYRLEVNSGALRLVDLTD